MDEICFNDARMHSDVIFVDARTPEEFSKDHIPGSVNIPILDDVERKQVGILYQKDPEKAFELGVEYYSRKLPKLVSELKALPKEKKIVVYCWRGGMRSKAICQAADMLGLVASQLQGGYKAYREYIRDFFAKYKQGSRFIVLWGMTGVGKTDLLRKLSSRGLPAIDLEGLAQHRSSLFGAVGLKPRTQKMFESLLFVELMGHFSENHIFIEGESRKVGDIIIPSNIYSHIKKGIHVRVNASLATRKKITADEYYSDDNIPIIKEIISNLKQKLSKDIVTELTRLLESGDKEKVAEILLTRYYDPLYEHTVDNMQYSYEVSNDDEDSCIKELEGIFRKLEG